MCLSNLSIVASRYIIPLRQLMPLRDRAHDMLVSWALFVFALAPVGLTTLELQMKNETAINEAPVASSPQYITLKCAFAPKLGKHADGIISYKVACNIRRTALFLAITDNSSGGYFSREYVSAARIEELLVNLDQSGFPSKVLKAAFTGRSSNNAGFLAAILQAEGLLSRAVDSETKHLCTKDWTKWKASALALGGTQDVTSSPSAQSIDAPDSLANNKAVAAKPQKPVNPTK